MRLNSQGEVLERTTGVKRRRIRLLRRGGSEEAEVPDGAVRSPCLDDALLRSLSDLARRAEAELGRGCQLEWALALDGLWMLGQRRGARST